MAAGLHRVIDRTPDGRVASESVALDAKAVEALERALKAELGDQVRFSRGDRALYATDASNYRQVPVGVVTPRTIDDVISTVRACAAHGVPITPRGGGTSLSGQTCNTAVVIDFSKHLHNIVSLDPDARLAEVEPGCILDHLRNAAEQHHLTFGPDPATHSRNTLGGMLGNDSCGEHSIMAGRTADNVRALDILTYDGLRMTVGPTSPEEYRQILSAGGRRADIYKAMRDFWDRYGAQFEKTYPDIPRRISGYENLDQLSWDKGFNVARALVGTEATCVTILKATLELVPSPPCRAIAILGFKDVFEAADQVCEVLEHKPIALEGMDELLIDFLTRKHMDQNDVEALPDGKGWLLVEFGADSLDEAGDKAKKLVEAFKGRTAGSNVLTDKAAQAKIWKVREDSLAATAHVPGIGPTHPGWEDSAVRREDVGKYLRELKALFDKYGYTAPVYGHFGDGLIHCRVDFDLRTEDGLKAWMSFLNEAADLVVRYDGSLSGEHGDGQSHGEFLYKMYGPELMEAQRAFKAIWDPQGRMNPGKVVDAYPTTSNLRSGPTYRPPIIRGTFAYPDDHDDFAKAAERCVGVGVCRQPTSETTVMCPSFMATREEKYSTRGRGRLLFEMVHGGAITDGWKSRTVEEALDLCLACKGCKRDCPVHVDMATYKAEFRSRHYQGRLRPRAAYSMGQIRRWAELAQLAPGLVNAAMHAPGLSGALKSIGGVSRQRDIPRFARKSFQAGWRGGRTGGGDTSGKRVVLWPDTFNNYFRTNTAWSAARLLQSLGYEVVVPKHRLCCGRPLYDWGWLDQAKSLWRRTMQALGPEIAAGVPVIGLEPACVSAFRDELVGLFPKDPTAERLSAQTYFLTEFLEKERAPLPHVAGKAIVQIHCHQHAVLDVKAERSVMKSCGLEAEVLKSGCCGMAGAFGFEASKYEVSMTAAERVLLPAVRQASQDAIVLANGFSCREQIEAGSGRRTMHIAEVLASGIPGG